MSDLVLEISGDHMNHLHREIMQTQRTHGGFNNTDGINLPSNADIVDIIMQFLHLLFPGFLFTETLHSGNVDSWCGYNLDKIHKNLTTQIVRSICIGCNRVMRESNTQRAARISHEILSQIPRIIRLLKKDVKAAYDGDPAATSCEEIIISYPFVLAIALHRVAHEFYLRKVPLIPRMISEYAHMRTGIDIHPGAHIGERFFIDHGTGVVIGETCVIGCNVKIYQMVTLGAMSFAKDEDGKIRKGGDIQRHPTIGDDVILYAGCTILGGETIIGRGSIVGGNVWLTSSVEPGTILIFNANETNYQRFTKQRGGSSKLSDAPQTM